MYIDIEEVWIATSTFKEMGMGMTLLAIYNYINGHIRLRALYEECISRPKLALPRQIIVFKILH